MALRSSFLLSIFLVFVSRLGCFCFCVVFFFNNFRLFGLLGSFLAFAALAAENLSYRSPGNADFNLIGYADDEVVIVQGYNRTHDAADGDDFSTGFQAVQHFLPFSSAASSAAATAESKK